MCELYCSKFPVFFVFVFVFFFMGACNALALLVALAAIQ